MDNFALGRIAYAAYAAAVGGTTFNNQPLPSFDELGERQQAGWQASATASAGYVALIGDEVSTDNSITGKVRSLSLDCMGRGYWLECVDGEGRPFDHFVRESYIARVNGEARAA